MLQDMRHQTVKYVITKNHAIFRLPTSIQYPTTGNTGHSPSQSYPNPKDVHKISDHWGHIHPQ